jgi:hypothetical protein
MISLPSSTNAELKCVLEPYSGNEPSSLTTAVFRVSITITVINPAIKISILTCACASLHTNCAGVSPSPWKYITARFFCVPCGSLYCPFSSVSGDFTCSPSYQHRSLRIHPLLVFGGTHLYNTSRFTLIKTSPPLHNKETLRNPMLATTLPPKPICVP